MFKHYIKQGKQIKELEEKLAALESAFKNLHTVQTETLEFLGGLVDQIHAINAEMEQKAKNV